MVELSEDWIVENTWLAPRQAEFFLLYYTEDHTIKSAGEEMGLKKQGAATHHRAIKEKLEKSEKTLELFNEVEDN